MPAISEENNDTGGNYYSQVLKFACSLASWDNVVYGWSVKLG